MLSNTWQRFRSQITLSLIVLLGTTVHADSLNIEILLDSSGSMAGYIDGQQKMELAKEALSTLAIALPDNGDVRIGLRIFGHQGDNTAAAKELSCASTERVLGPDEFNIEGVRIVEKTVIPSGWTPLSLAIEAAARDLQYEEGRKRIIVISDGDESCSADPCSVAKAVSSTTGAPSIHLIGIGLEKDAISTARCVTDASAGLFLEATSAPGIELALLGLAQAEMSTVGNALRLAGNHAERLPRISFSDVGVVLERVREFRPEAILVSDGVIFRSNVGSSIASQGTAYEAIANSKVEIGQHGITVTSEGGQVSISITGDGRELRPTGSDIRDLGQSLRGNRASREQQVLRTAMQTIVNCPAGGDCVCEDSSCIMNCPNGGCVLNCSAATSGCIANCDEGGCEAKCPIGGCLALNCGGGECTSRSE